MKVSFLGSGAWATALANVVSDNGHEVLLYGVCKEEIDDININHQNKKYFKDVILNESIKGTLNIIDVLDSEVIVIAVPSSQIRVVLNKIKDKLVNKPIILNVSKGFDKETFKRLSEVIKEEISEDKISGVVT